MPIQEMKISPNFPEIKISDIKIGKRTRQDFGNLYELADSINSVGLLQPICVKENLTLIAGERRIRAFQLLKLTTIPVYIVNLENELKGEFAENEYRKDFTFSERKNLLDELKRQEGIINGNNQHIKKSVTECDKIVTQGFCPAKNPLSGIHNPISAYTPTTPSPPTPLHTLAGFTSKNESIQVSAILNKPNNKIAPELIHKLDNQEISVSSAYKLIQFPLPTQKRLLSLPEKETTRIVNALTKPIKTNPPIITSQPPPPPITCLSSMTPDTIQYEPHIKPIIELLKTINDVGDQNKILIWIEVNW